jgi:hypothetical protein
MATTTPNFGWAVPTSTDLVKDGAVAIETLGDSIDASLVDLKGGTTGQVLSKASGTDMDFSWVAQDDSNAIQNALLTTTGDTIFASAASTPARRAIGTTGQVLTVSGGLPVWATPAAGTSGLTLVSATTFSAVSSHAVDSIFTSTYKYYRAVLKFTASGLNTMTVRFRASGSSNTSANYYSVNRSTDSAGTNEYVGSIAGTSISLLGKYNTDFNGVSFDILDPQAALDKIITGTAFSRGSTSGGLATVNFGGAFNSSSAMDGLELIASSGTISGTLKIYGYQN